MISTGKYPAYYDNTNDNGYYKYYDDAFVGYDDADSETGDSGDDDDAYVYSYSTPSSHSSSGYIRGRGTSGTLSTAAGSSSLSDRPHDDDSQQYAYAYADDTPERISVVNDAADDGDTVLVVGDLNDDANNPVRLNHIVTTLLSILLQYRNHTRTILEPY